MAGLVAGIMMLAACQSRVFTGRVQYPNGVGVAGVQCRFMDRKERSLGSTSTDTAGRFRLSVRAKAAPAYLSFYHPADLQGVTTHDLVLISKINQGETPVDSLPVWVYRAADVNQDGLVSRQDIVMLRWAILKEKAEPFLPEWEFWPAEMVQQVCDTLNPPFCSRNAFPIDPKTFHRNLLKIVAVRSGDVDCSGCVPSAQ